MKVELSKEELKDMQELAESNKVARWLVARENMKFTVGDVLVKHTVQYDYDNDKESWAPELINSSSKMVQRYVYVYEDAHGIGYIRPLKVSTGELGVEISCLTDYDYSYTRFEVDPEFAEQSLLGGEFDIKEVHKRSLEQRKIIQKMNRQIGVRPKALSEFNTFFESLKVGDTFYSTKDFTGRYVEEYKLTGKTKVTRKALEKESNWTWKRFVENCHPDADYTYKFKYKSSYGREEQLILDLEGNVLYKVPPAKEQ